MNAPLSQNATSLLHLLRRVHATRPQDAGRRLGLGRTALKTAADALVERRLARYIAAGRVSCLVPYCEEAPYWGPHVVALRDWKLAPLFDAIRERDLPLLAEILAHAETEWGWDESTTRWWVGRLELVGLVSVVCLANEPNGKRLRDEGVHPKAHRILAGERREI